MASYVSESEFADITTAPPGALSWVEQVRSSWLPAQLERVSRYVDTRLRKRYTVPFDPVPEVVRGWVVDIVTHRLYQFRGYDPTDASSADVRKSHDQALADLAEAANAETGLFDLPAIDTADSSAVTKGFGFAYNEASPFVGSDVQLADAATEDARGYGH